MENKRKKAISLFSGAGGDSLGLKKAGYDVVAYSEIDKHARHTHDLNFPKSVLLGEDENSDVTKITEDELRKYKGKIDVIFAGFPCQGFSHAGKKLLDDPRNQLFKEFVRIVDIVKPKFIIGENVKGLLERKNYNNVSYAVEINSEFENIGYNMIDPMLLKAEEYGVPQMRRRIFFVGSRDVPLDMDKIPKIKYKSLKKIITPTLYNSIKIDINKFPYLKKANDAGKLTWVDTTDEPSGRAHPFLVSKIMSGEISFKVRKSPHHVQVLDLNMPSKTIHTGYIFQPRLFVLLKKNNLFYIRELTVNELQQIQGFPKNYKFIDHKTHSIRQIGNAVPPKLVQLILNQINKPKNG